MEIDDQTLQIELMASDVARTGLLMACVLRETTTPRESVRSWEE